MPPTKPKKYAPNPEPVGYNRPGFQRVNVDFPIDILAQIDAECARLGIQRQAFIKMRIADTLPSAKQGAA